MQLIELPPLARLTDRHGKIRPIAGCSVIGRFEFADRLLTLNERLEAANNERHIGAFYDEDAVFRHIVDECFQLNGIDLDWLTIAAIDPLLFCAGIAADGTAYPGWLPMLNQPDATTSTAPAPLGESPTLAEALAALTLHTGSIGDGIYAANIPNGKLMVQIVEARSRLIDPKGVKAKASRRPPSADEAYAVLSANRTVLEEMRQPR